jgi:hypothetical protein
MLLRKAAKATGSVRREPILMTTALAGQRPASLHIALDHTE